jgi:hypothetical protein
MANCLAFEVYTGFGRACYVFLDKLAAPFSPNPLMITCVKAKAAELLHLDAVALEGEEEVSATLQAATHPASLFTWSPKLGFLVNHACASGNLCLGICGSSQAANVQLH